MRIMHKPGFIKSNFETILSSLDSDMNECKYNSVKVEVVARNAVGILS